MQGFTGYYAGSECPSVLRDNNTNTVKIYYTDPNTIVKTDTVDPGQ